MRASWVAMLLGVALLFWQHDVAPVDYLFAFSIVGAGVSAARGKFVGINWTESLLIAAVGILGAATLLAQGSIRALAILTYLVLASLVVARLASSRSRIQTLETCLILAMTVSAVLLAVAELTMAFGRPIDVLVFGSRSQGLFKDPNVAGAFASCVLPIGASWAARQVRAGRLMFLVAALCTGSVLFSDSRTALALLIAGVVLCALTLRNRPSLIAALAGSVLAVTLALVGARSVQDRDELASDHLSSNSRSAHNELLHDYDRGGRLAAWCYGVEMFLEAPLGTGAGSFEPRATERFESEEPRCFGIQTTELLLTPSAHNTYLRVAVESGAVGALALFAYWAMIMLASLRATSRPDAWIAAFALVLAAGLTIDTLHWRQLWLYVGVLSAGVAPPLASRRSSP